MRDDRRTRREPGQDYAANAAGDAVRSVFCPDAPERLEGDVPVRRDQPRHVGKLGMRFKIFCRDRPQYRDTTPEQLEVALSGRFVSCNVQYRDVKTDALVCNVFVQKPPEGF